MAGLVPKKGKESVDDPKKGKESVDDDGSASEGDPGAKAAMKKPAAKAIIKKAVAKKAVAKMAVAKKPAAKAATGKPTPEGDARVASNIDLSDLHKLLRGRLAGNTRKKFTSLAWHRAKTLAERSGFCPDDAMAIGRHAARHASTMFSKKFGS